MFSTELSLESNITPPVSSSNQLRIYNLKNKDLIDVGEYLVAYNKISFLPEEYGSGTVAYSSASGTLFSSATGLDGSFSYSNVRTGWIYLYSGSHYLKVKVKQYASNSYYSDSNGEHRWVLEVLEVRGLEKEFDYVFFDSLLLTRDNNVEVEIEGVDYGETSTNNIDIGTNGSPISASLDLTAGDISNLGGSTVYLSLTIREDNAGGSVIYSSTVSRSTAGNLSISRTLLDSEIPNDTAYVNVSLSDTP